MISIPSQPKPIHTHKHSGRATSILAQSHICKYMQKANLLVHVTSFLYSCMPTLIKTKLKTSWVIAKGLSCSWSWLVWVEPCNNTLPAGFIPQIPWWFCSRGPAWAWPGRSAGQSCPSRPCSGQPLRPCASLSAQQCEQHLPAHPTVDSTDRKLDWKWHRTWSRR